MAQKTKILGEEMTIDYSHATSYCEYAFDYYIDNIVYKKLKEIYKKEKSDKNHTYNNSSLSSNVISSHYSCVIFSALAIEAEINLLGSIVFTNDFFENYLDRLAAYLKFSVIIEKVENIKVKVGEQPMQGIKTLFSVRNEYVHDKGKRIKNSEQYESELKKRRIKYSVEDAIETIVLFDTYCRKYFEGLIGFGLVSDIMKTSYKNWKKETRYLVSSDLPFGGALFPDLFEYHIFQRRHMGFYNENICIDTSTNTIIVKK